VELLLVRNHYDLGHMFGAVMTFFEWLFSVASDVVMLFAQRKAVYFSIK
jgi:hypothetical protein